MAAVVIALLMGAALLLAMDVDPITYYQKMFTMGMVGNKFPLRRFGELRQGLCPPGHHLRGPVAGLQDALLEHRRRGQFILGAICAAAAAFKLGRSCPSPWWCWSWPCAASWAAACTGPDRGPEGEVRYTNETLLTLMLNYIALYLLQFLGETKAGWNFFLDPDSARPKFAGFPDNADMITFPSAPST